MSVKQSNPIQQRMEMLLEKWEAAVATAGVNVVRLHAEDNEKDMVSTFYTYLLGVDTCNTDIPIIFESIYHNDEQYTNSLLKELEDLLHIWNTANKDDLHVETEPIDWKPDYSLAKQENPAYLFVENMNNLALSLPLQKSSHLVAALKVSFTEAYRFTNWLQFAVKAGLNGRFKIVIDDSVSHPFYEKIANKYSDYIITLIPALDMDSAMQQVAAMGSPNDPAVQYRKTFILLMQAIEKRKETEAEKQGAACIEIALKNLKINAYWIGQIITVYAALANDQVGYKNYRKAIAYSTLGVQAAEKSAQIVADAYIYRKFIAQAVMLRASLCTVRKEWENAVADFAIAADHYTYTNDTILALEAFRMLGFCNEKQGDTDTACRALAKAIGIAKQVPANIIKFTTFAGVIELMITINNSKYISREEVEAAAQAVYGNEWMKEIGNWKNPEYERTGDVSQAVATL